MSWSGSGLSVSRLVAVAATPITRMPVESSPSSAPSTAARSQPIVSVRSRFGAMATAMGMAIAAMRTRTAARRKSVTVTPARPHRSEAGLHQIEGVAEAGLRRSSANMRFC